MPVKSRISERAQRCLGFAFLSYFLYTAFPVRAEAQVSASLADVTILGAVSGDLVTLAHLQGDFDGDGDADWLVFANGASPPGRPLAGKLYIFWNPATLDGTVDLASTGTSMSVILPRNGDYGAYARISVGDFNDDGRDDIVLGVPVQYPSLYAVGKAYVIFGTSAFPSTVDLASPPISVSTITGNIWGEGWLGIASTSCDFDADGIMDLVLAAPFMDESELYVVYGSASFPASLNLTTASSGITRIVDPTYGTGAGLSLANGDVDKDGAFDLLIGAPGSVNGMFDGRAVLLYGDSAAPDTIRLDEPSIRQSIFVTGLGVEGNLGAAVALADLDGDSETDAAISAPNANPPGCTYSDCGTVYALSRIRDFPTNTNLDALSPMVGRYIGGEYKHLGSAIAAGDIDGDGNSDLAMSARTVPAATSPTRVVLPSGPTPYGQVIAVSEDTLATSFVGKNPGDDFGNTIGMFDINDDSTCDLVVGAYLADPLGRGNAGETYVFLGVPVATPLRPSRPAYLALEAFPNPFGESATIRYSLPAAGDITFSVYDVRGRVIDTFKQSNVSRGDHAFRWSPKDSRARIPTGVYFGRLEAGFNQQTVRMLFIR